MKTLLLIDANSLVHRCFHALPHLTTPAGDPIQAIYGLASICLKILKEDKPDYAAALFDRPEPTFRKEMYEAYKAHRPEAPSELVSQIIEAHNLFDAFGVKIFEMPGFEADDLIATLSTRFKTARDARIEILTGDLDALQLVQDDNIVVRAFRKGVSDTVIYDEAAIMARYNLRPEQLVDYKALVGDPSDNIKGVPGIGEKTASRLLAEFGSIACLYKNLDKEPKLKQKFETYKDHVQEARQLIMLRRDVPLRTSSLNDLTLRIKSDAIAAYLKKMGFKTLLTRLRGNATLFP